MGKDDIEIIPGVSKYFSLLRIYDGKLIITTMNNGSFDTGNIYYSICKFIFQQNRSFKTVLKTCMQFFVQSVFQMAEKGEDKQRRKEDELNRQFLAMFQEARRK